MVSTKTGFGSKIGSNSPGTEDHLVRKGPRFESGRGLRTQVEARLTGCSILCWLVSGCSASRTFLVLVSFLLTACSTPAGTLGTSTGSRIHNDLTGMACPSISFCFAVGNTYENGASGYANYRTLIERWNGSSWFIVNSPDGAKQDSHLAKVSCPTSSLCFAVGYDGPYTPNGHVLIERWNGSIWSIVDTPKISGAANSLLRDIACVSSSFCFAVGQYVPPAGNGGGLIERWDGSSWTVMPDVHEGVLFAVGCATRTLCFAVGDHYVFGGSGEVDHTLTERWDGALWKVVESPDPKSPSQLEGLTCISTSHCFASGYLGNGQHPDAPMIEAWDGSTWAILIAPQPSEQVDPAQIDDRLISVSCASRSLCFSVGWHRWTPPGTIHSQTLVERWSGTSWTIVRSPNGSPSPGVNNGLEAVACPNTSRCLAIGHYDGPDGFFQTLAEQSNGASWSIVPSANR